MKTHNGEPAQESIPKEGEEVPPLREPEPEQPSPAEGPEEPPIPFPEEDLPGLPGPPPVEPPVPVPGSQGEPPVPIPEEPVPPPGEPVPSPPGAPGPSVPGPAPAPKTANLFRLQKYDVFTDTMQQLTVTPGKGPEVAAEILRRRSKTGSSTMQLLYDVLDSTGKVLRRIWEEPKNLSKMPGKWVKEGEQFVRMAERSVPVLDSLGEPIVASGAGALMTLEPVAGEAAAAAGGVVGASAHAIGGLFSMFLPEGGQPSQPLLDSDPSSGAVDIADSENQEGNHDGAEKKPDVDTVDNSNEHKEPEGNEPKPSKGLDDHEQFEQTKTNLEVTTAQNTAHTPVMPTPTSDPTSKSDQEEVQGSEDKLDGDTVVKTPETTAALTTVHKTMQATEVSKQTSALKAIPTDHKSPNGQSNGPAGGDDSKTTSSPTSVDATTGVKQTPTQASTTDGFRGSNSKSGSPPENRESKTSSSPTSTATPVKSSTQRTTIGNLESDYLVPHTLTTPTIVHKTTQATETYEQTSIPYPYPNSHLPLTIPSPTMAHNATEATETQT